MMQRKSRSKEQDGFTLIEVMIAIAILSIGVLAVVASFAAAVGATQNAQESLIARQKALEAMESIYTARNSQQIIFSQIANVANGGIFQNGSTKLLCAGPDGLVGTNDDVNCPASGPCAAGPECIVLPGPDGILGTTDDVAMSLANFSRTITVSNVLESDGVTVNPTLKQINVTITYQANAATHTYSVDGLISSFR